MAKNGKYIIVTLDGPAASGKSTTARLVAKKMGWLYLDTGAMYRAMAVKTVRNGIALDDPSAIAEIARGSEVRLEPTDEKTRVFIDGDEVTEAIRTPEIDKAVGPVCEVPLVREMMVDLQRKISEGANLVAEGRDMGTVVFPDAPLKFYMIASIEARAKRRLEDLKQKGIEIPLAQLMEDIRKRDERDSGRSHSPLKPADDAIELDTSDLSIDEQVQLIIDHIDEKKKALA